MNVTSFITKYYENKWQRRVRKNKPNSNPIQSQYKANSKPIKPNSKPIKANTKPKRTQYGPNQTRSEFIPKGAQIPTGGLLGILKPGTNFSLTQIPQISSLKPQMSIFGPHHPRFWAKNQGFKISYSAFSYFAGYGGSVVRTGVLRP